MADELALLERLVALVSENPPGDEREIASFCAEFFTRLGAEVEIVAERPARPNVIATLQSMRKGPRIVLQAHLDTKPIAHHGGAAAWTGDPFQLSVREGRAFGVGAADTKGGAAAQMAAIERVGKAGSFAGEIIWIGAADEENGALLGTDFLRREGKLQGDFAVVAEPTGCRASLAQLGNVWARVTATGLDGHAGTPWACRDANAAMWSYLDRLQLAVASRDPDPRFPGHPRVNAGRLHGGEHCGSVSGRCEADIDIRLRPGEERADTFSLMQDLAREEEAVAGVTFDVVPYAQGGCSAHEVSPDNPFAQTMARVVRKLGGDPNPLPFPGGTDAYLFGEAGLKALVFGPGSLAQAHAADEFVAVGEFDFAVDAYTRFLEEAMPA